MFFCSAESSDVDMVMLATSVSSTVLASNFESFLFFTDSRIVLLDTEHKKVQTIFEENDEIELAKVMPISG